MSRTCVLRFLVLCLLSFGLVVGVCFYSFGIPFGVLHGSRWVSDDGVPVKREGLTLLPLGCDLFCHFKRLELVWKRDCLVVNFESRGARELMMNYV